MSSGAFLAMASTARTYASGEATKASSEASSTKPYTRSRCLARYDRLAGSSSPSRSAMVTGQKPSSSICADCSSAPVKTMTGSGGASVAAPPPAATALAVATESSGRARSSEAPTRAAAWLATTSAGERVGVYESRNWWSAAKVALRASSRTISSSNDSQSLARVSKRG
eukprot:scaffold6432_cov107-Isochrysis_galbana.AAC.2